MYHPSRGGVRGGRDQFNWDDVKVDKHRENYLGHSIKAPVGRWQRGKDLHWYNKDGKLNPSAAEIARQEIERVKAEEEQAMREALGLAPIREKHTTGHHLDKHELADLLKKGKTAEELSETYTEAELIQGLGFAPVPGQKRVSGYERGAQLPGASTVPDSSPVASPRIDNENVGEDEKQNSKMEKREDKEKRKQEKRAAKLKRRDERKQHKTQSSSRHHSSDDERSQSRKKRRRRHDSDSE